MWKQKNYLWRYFSMRQLLGPTRDTAVVAQHFVSEDPGFPFLETQVRVEGPNHSWSILRHLQPCTPRQCGGCSILSPAGTWLLGKLPEPNSSQTEAPHRHPGMALISFHPHKTCTRKVTYVVSTTSGRKGSAAHFTLKNTTSK